MLEILHEKTKYERGVKAGQGWLKREVKVEEKGQGSLERKQKERRERLEGEEKEQQERLENEEKE